MGEDQAIEAFWRWWADNLELLTATVDKGMTPELISGMGQAVHAIHPELQWEFSRGSRAAHGLAVTGAGSSELRLLAERWRRAGPGDSETFEFHTTRQPASREQVCGLQIRIEGGPPVDFGACRIGVEEDPGRRRLHLDVWHPAFATLPENAVMQFVFLILDAAIGEDAVERWIGGIAQAAEEPADAVDLAGLRDRVDALPAQWPPGEASWTMAAATHPDGRRSLLTVDTALKRWDHPLLDTWCTVRIPYRDREDGMPADGEELEACRAMENALVEELGEDGAHVGHVTGEGAYVVMLYLTAARAAEVEAWAARQGRTAVVAAVADPQWERRPPI